MTQTDKHHVEKIAPEQVDQIVDLAEQVWRQTFIQYFNQDKVDFLYRQMYQPDVLRQQIKSGRTRFFVLHFQGQAIGYASLSEVDMPVKTYKVDKLYLLQNRQGHGHGRWFMNWLIDDCRSNDAKQVILNVNRGNQEAIQFYLNYGWTIDKEIDIPAGDGHVYDDYQMSFQIQKR